MIDKKKKGGDAKVNRNTTILDMGSSGANNLVQPLLL